MYMCLFVHHTVFVLYMCLYSICVCVNTTMYVCVYTVNYMHWIGIFVCLYTIQWLYNVLYMCLFVHRSVFVLYMCVFVHCTCFGVHYTQIQRMFMCLFVHRIVCTPYSVCTVLCLCVHCTVFVYVFVWTLQCLYIFFRTLYSVDVLNMCLCVLYIQCIVFCEHCSVYTLQCLHIFFVTYVHCTICIV